jgi:hypothetical protein
VEKAPKLAEQTLLPRHCPRAKVAFWGPLPAVSISEVIQTAEKAHATGGAFAGQAAHRKKLELHGARTRSDGDLLAYRLAGGEDDHTEWLVCGASRHEQRTVTFPRSLARGRASEPMEMLLAPLPFWLLTAEAVEELG